MHFRSRTQRMVLGPLILALLAAACSGSSTTTVSESAASEPESQNSEQAPEPTAEPEPTAAAADPTVAPEPTAEPTPLPDPTPVPATNPVYFASELEPGDCFNRLVGNPSLTPPEEVPCDGLHEEEVYAKAQLDDPAGAPYPGDDVVADRVAAELCDAATADFLGASFDQVPVATRLLFPVEEDWDAGDRNIMCSAASYEQDTRKIGTAAGGTINTDDVLIARAGLANDGVDFDDWIVLTEHAAIDTIGSLSDAQFELPLRRPFPLPFGFMFHARPAGDEGHPTTTWGYNWEDRQFTDLGTILNGYELASTVVADGVIIFAARENPGDDWDLWTTASGDAEIVIGGDGDQHYPTLTPDQTQLVYQDKGDIWIANVDGSDPLQLTSGPANDWESIVSPDGDTVVFASDRSGNDDLWAVPTTGGEAVNLTNHPADENWPVFSEDGNYLYFGSDRLVPEDDRSIVMVMNPDGSNQSWFGVGFELPGDRRAAGRCRHGLRFRSDTQRALQLRTHRR